MHGKILHQLIDDTTYEDEKVLDYVQDLVFVPFDEKGQMIGDTSNGTITPSDAKNMMLEQ